MGKFIQWEFQCNQFKMHGCVVAWASDLPNWRFHSGLCFTCWCLSYISDVKVKLTRCQRRKKIATQSNLCLLKKYKFQLFSCVRCRKPKYYFMLIRVKIRFELPYSWSLNPSLNHQYETNYTGKTPVLLFTLLSEPLKLIGLVRH